MRPLTMLGVGAVTALLVAACGSDSEQLSEEEFLAAANEICAVGNEEIAALFDEVEERRGLEDATEEELQQIIEEEAPAVRDAFVTNVRGQIADVRDLNGPSDLEDELDPLLDEISEEFDAVAELSAEEFIFGEDEPSEATVQMQALGLTTCAEDVE